MKHLLRRRMVVGGIVALCLATTGIVLATIPGPDGVIYACYTKSTGTIRIIVAGVSTGVRSVTGRS